MTIVTALHKLVVTRHSNAKLHVVLCDNNFDTKLQKIVVYERLSDSENMYPNHALFGLSKGHPIGPWWLGQFKTAPEQSQSQSQQVLEREVDVDLWCNGQLTIVYDISTNKISGVQYGYVQPPLPFILATTTTKTLQRANTKIFFPCDACGMPANHKCIMCRHTYYCSNKCQTDSHTKHTKTCISHPFNNIAVNTMKRLLADHKAMLLLTHLIMRKKRVNIPDLLDICELLIGESMKRDYQILVLLPEDVLDKNGQQVLVIGIAPDSEETRIPLTPTKYPSGQIVIAKLSKTNKILTPRITFTFPIGMKIPHEDNMCIYHSVPPCDALKTRVTCGGCDQGKLEDGSLIFILANGEFSIRKLEFGENNGVVYSHLHRFASLAAK